MRQITPIFSKVALDLVIESRKVLEAKSNIHRVILSKLAPPLNRN